MASCSICEKPAQFRCSRCKVERYCSRECQKDHWPHHKTRCAQLAAAAKSIPVDKPAAMDAGESASRRLQPQPPALPLQPQPPVIPASREHSQSFRTNPRTARLLGELPPSLQPDTALPAEQATGPGTLPSSSSEPQGHGGRTSISAASTAAGCTSSQPAEGSGAAGGSGVAGIGENGVSSTRLLSSPPQHQAQSPQAPRTPFSMQPAPPPGRPQMSSRASMRLVRAHLREPALPAAGELQVEGSGLMRNGSILDRVMPSPTAPLTPGRTADCAASHLPDSRAASPQQQKQGQQQPDLVHDHPSPAAVIYGEDGMGSANPLSNQDLQQQQQQEAEPQLPLTTCVETATALGGTTEAEAIARLSDLPSELLLEVLKALPARSLAAAAAVCRSWRRAAREPWLWVRQLCAMGYPLPAAAYLARRNAAPAAQPKALAAATGAIDEAHDVTATEAGDDLRAVPGVRGIRAVRAVRAAGGSSHEDFLGGLRAGFLDRLQQQQQQQQQQGQQQVNQGQQLQQQQQQHAHGQRQVPPPPPPAAADLKDLYGRTVRMESNWRTARYAETPLREHSSNVECLAFQVVEPWGSVLLSAAWDGSVRVFSLGPASGAPQQARCVRRYRGHTGWITCMAAGRHQVVTASTDRRVAAWRYYSESSDPWVALEHPQEVTLVRFCYTPPPPATTHYLAHHIYQYDPMEGAVTAAGDAGRCLSGGGGRGQITPSDSGGGGTGVSATGPSPQSRGSAPAAAGPTSASEELEGGMYGTAEGMTLTLPYDPQWEDWVVTGCIDGVIRLWHLPTKQLLRTFSGHGDVVWGIAVLYSSSVMVSSSRDCTTRLWRLPPFSAMQAVVAAPHSRAAEGSSGGGGGSGADARGGEALRTRPGLQTLEAMATLCGHTSAILCMDVHRAAPGVVPPPSAAARAAAASAAAAGDHNGFGDHAGGDGGAGAGGRALRSVELGAYDDMITVLSSLLNTSLVEPPDALQGSAVNGGGGGREDLAGASAATTTAAAVAAGMLPVWLVATGGADAVVRVWNLATAQCHTTLRGHSVGVLSVQFGYLPRHGESYRDQLLLPPDLDVTAAAGPPSLALPPGQYGSRAQGQRLPPSQRLVLVTGSVREVRVWDPISGLPLVQLSDHNGPVTSVALVHGAVVTLAMNDGLIVYKCNGLDGATAAAAVAAAAAAATQRNAGNGGVNGSAGAATVSAGTMGPAAVAAAAAATTSRPLSAVGRLRREVSAQRRVLEPVICMQDAPHHSFSAALAVQLEGLAVGSGTGDITYLDFRSRTSPLPVLHARRRPV
ncbi:hypothetical protein VaNZ11_010326 [Volvox africanus]|uniref:Uncharacterized protein n=1 Tax=Volvox africanus TaxID=51714 RepID=A0ABQ5SAN2_9CHLO|nr:hypothetical protein VaNZ11_010326 [Volvox africanus]